jgi:alpha-beta hydrolase superfamily lysophospholipase
MLRGYVDQKEYVIGKGTQRGGEFFAQNGFITIAPDFLGYGDSSIESSDIFESRFQTYTTALALMKSIKSINNWDGENVFIWAHSNGGQVALTALEISGVDYPTVLWAPNSAKLPYSILYYLDESPDNGKLVITKLSDFMANYDVKQYSFVNYLSQIKAPIRIDQGTGDTTVPPAWSNLLLKELKNATVSATLIKYPGADHNLQPSWTNTIEADLIFYKDNLVN